MKNPVDVDTAAARLTLNAAIDDALLPEEIVAVIFDPLADEGTLLHAISRIKATTYWGSTDRDSMVYSVLASSECTERCVEVLDGDYFFRMMYVLRHAAQNDLPLSPVAIAHLVNDRYTGRDIPSRISILQHQNVTPEIVAFYATDYRVTITRVLAKHRLLNAVSAEKFARSDDAKTRANVAGQDVLPEESLRLLKHDRDPMVVRAAVKAIKSRGIADTDELDAVMDDEVSLFFLTASDDEMTLTRLGSSPDSPDETLCTIASLGGRGRLAVAGNTSAPSSLIESMSIEVSKGDYWDGLIGNTLAANPQNTPDGLRALLDAARWDRTLFLTVLKHKNCTEDMVRSRSIYGARVRVAAIATGFLNTQDMDELVRYEYRDSVLAAAAKYDKTSTTALRQCWGRGGERVRKAALAALELRGEPLDEPEAA